MPWTFFKATMQEKDLNFVRHLAALQRNGSQISDATMSAFCSLVEARRQHSRHRKFQNVMGGQQNGATLPQLPYYVHRHGAEQAIFRRHSTSLSSTLPAAAVRGVSLDLRRRLAVYTSSRSQRVGCPRTMAAKPGTTSSATNPRAMSPRVPGDIPIQASWGLKDSGSCGDTCSPPKPIRV